MKFTPFRRMIGIVILWALSVLGGVVAAHSQNTIPIFNVSLVDGNGDEWVYTPVTMNLYVPDGSKPVYIYGGDVPRSIRFTTDQFGVATLTNTLPANNQIANAGSCWNVTVNVLASSGPQTVGCFRYIRTGSIETISVNFADWQLKTPSFALSSPIGYGYSTAEITNTPSPGTFFYPAVQNQCLIMANTSVWESCGGTGYSSLPTPPPATIFTFINKTDGANFNVYNNNKSILLEFPPITSVYELGLITVQAPAAPFSIASFGKCLCQNENVNRHGLYIGNSTNQYLGIEFQYESDGVIHFYVYYYPAVAGGTPVIIYQDALGANFSMPTPTDSGAYLRWRDDGTTAYADVSLDGWNWIPITTVTLSSYLGTVTQYGYGGFNINTANNNWVSLSGWYPTLSAAQ